MTKRVLIVEDEERICQVLQDYLEGPDYDIVIAPTLSSAREQIDRNGLPDIVVVDMTLPDGNGVSFLHELRANGRTREIPIILTTAHTVQRIENAIIDDKPNDCILKPFSLRDFKDRLDRQLLPKT
jgi:DNA-binding response OmpR family regulator